MNDDDLHLKRMKSIATLHDLAEEMLEGFREAVHDMADGPHKTKCLELLAKLDHDFQELPNE